MKRYAIYNEDINENITSHIFYTDNPLSLISKIIIFVLRCNNKYKTVIEDLYITGRANYGK